MAGPIEIRYSYKSVPTLLKFSQDSSFFRLVCGPYGSGKSSASVVELVKRMQAQRLGPDGIRRSRWLVVRNTYRQLADSTVKTFMQWLPPHQFGDYRVSNNSYHIRAFEGVDAEVNFRALDRPQDLSNLLSAEYTGCWMNEMRDLSWPIVEAIGGRIGRYPSQREGGVDWYGMWGDSNPGDTDSKMYKYFVEQMAEHPKGHASLFMQPSGLSPQAENLPNLPGGRDYYKKMAVGKDREWVKVYVDGLWGFVIDGRPVFLEYNDTAHCNQDIKPVAYAPIYRGWDFGLTPACTFLQLLPTGQLIVFDELLSDSMGVDQFSDEVLTHSTIQYPDWEFIDIGDPAGVQRSQTDEKTCFQILQSKGIMIEPGLQSVAIRLESVRRPLTRLVAGKPGFQLHPRCKTLRKGFMGGYQYRRLQTSAEKYTAVPDKNSYSHIHDSLQYPLTRIFGGGLTEPRAVRQYDDSSFDQFERSEITGY